MKMEASLQEMRKEVNYQALGSFFPPFSLGLLGLKPILLDPINGIFRLLCFPYPKSDATCYPLGISMPPSS